MALVSLPRIELARFTRHRLTRAALVVIAVIPALYGGLYLAANWNPTGELDHLTAAVVDDDQPSVVQASDGTSSTIDAGDELVARLTGEGTASDAGGARSSAPNTSGFTWVETTADAAAAGLDDGSYAATVVIPRDFSASLGSVSGDTPRQAQLTVTTNDADNYIVGTVTNTIASALRQQLQSSSSKSYLDNIYVAFTSIHDELADASDGAAQVASGAASAQTGSSDLAVGLGQLASGSSTLARGGTTLASGAAALSTGAGSLATGLSSLDAATSALPAQTEQLAEGATAAHTGSTSLAAGSAETSAGAAQLATSAGNLADGTGSVADGLAALSANYGALTDLQRQAAIAELSAGADRAATGADQLSAGASTLSGATASVAGGAASLDSGLAQLETGTAALATSAPGLRDGIVQASDGADSVASGAREVASGAAQAASGSADLATGAATASDGAQSLTDGLTSLTSGAESLADGLADGAEEVPAYTAAQREDLAAVASDPVAVDRVRENAVAVYGEGLAPHFIPLALWVGGIVTYLVLRPLSPRALASTARSWRVALSGLSQGVLFGVIQAAVLMTVLIFAVGLGSPHLGWVIAFTVLVAIVFTSIHHALVALLGGIGRLVALVLLMLQLTSAGGTYPVETSPGFFGAIGTYLPMTYAVSGLRHLIAGGNLGIAVSDAGSLVVFFGVAVSLSIFAAHRKRCWTVSRLHPTLAI